MESTTRSTTVGRLQDISVMATAALLPEEFSLDWILVLSDERATTVVSELAQGVKLGILEQRQAGLYAFRNPDKQDECLLSLTEEEKRRLHRQAADLIKQQFPRDEEMLPVLVHHLTRTINDMDDCRVLYDAGEALRRSYRQSDALLCYRKVIQTLDAITGREADHLYIDAVRMYARIASTRDDPEWVKARIEDAIMRAQSDTLRPYQALLKMHLAALMFQNHRWHSRSIETFEEGWAIAEEFGNPDIMHYALTFRLSFRYWQGRFRDVLLAYEENAAEVPRYPRSRFPVYSTCCLGSSMVCCGRVSEGIGFLRHLYDHYREIGDSGDLYIVALSLAQALLGIGRGEDGLAVLGEIDGAPEDRRSRYLPLSFEMLSAEAYALKQDYEKATVCFIQGVSLGYPWDAILKWDRCNQLAANMDRKTWRRLTDYTLEQIIEYALQSFDVHNRGMAHLLKARRLMKAGGSSRDIESALLASIRELGESGHEIQLAKVRFELSRIYLRRGDKEKAEDIFLKAYQVLEPINPSLIPEDLSLLAEGRETRTRLLEGLSDLSREITGIRDRSRLIFQLLSDVNGFTGTERTGIFQLSDSEPDKIELAAAKNLSEAHLEHPDFQSSLDIIRETFHSGTGRIMKTDTSDVAGGLRSPILGDLSSCFCVPLSVGGEVTGVLYGDNRYLDNYLAEADIGVLSVLAGQAAIALDNARAYDEIKQLNRQLLEERQYYVEENVSRSQFDDFIGESPAMQHVFDEIIRVAGQDTVVLVQGETGAGKELVARTIHRESKRKSASLISADCSVFPEGIISGELFGHEKGAFTGAHSRKVGRFELANGGTLFLDEIGNLPMDVQVKLLRVLQTGEFQRVGGIQTIHSDFRLITATNCDLGSEVAAGRFREDLYYRINVFPITVPPLRERKEDIAALALFFLRRGSVRMGKPFDSIPKSEMEKLLRYPWPGNVREMQNVIERGIILSSGHRFRVPPLTQSRPRSPEAGEMTLAENERQHILRVLEKTGGKLRGKDGAAESLGVPYSTLYYRMQKHGIKLVRRAAS